MDTLELHFPVSAKYIRIAAQMAATLGNIICQDIEQSSRDTDFVAHLELVVSEACTNAIKHGSKTDSEEGVIMQVMLDDQAMTIKVKDANAPFDFTAIREPDLEHHPENGYGIFLMRNFMDEVHYAHENGWNCITLVKYKPCLKA